MENGLKSWNGKPFRDFSFTGVVLGASFFSFSVIAPATEAKPIKPEPRPTPYVIPGLIALTPSDAINEDFLGLRVGMNMAEVRERLRRLHAIDLAEETIASGKSTSGTKKLPDREYDKGGIRKRGWKLPETTSFEWVTVTSNRRGIITLITAAYRADQAKPFSEIANLDKAAAKTDRGVTWNVLRPSGNFLIVVNGAEGKAATVSMKLAEISPIFVPAIESHREK